jgi:hypothetical protein
MDDVTCDPPSDIIQIDVTKTLQQLIETQQQIVKWVEAIQGKIDALEKRLPQEKSTLVQPGNICFFTRAPTAYAQTYACDTYLDHNAYCMFAEQQQDQQTQEVHPHTHQESDTQSNTNDGSHASNNNDGSASSPAVSTDEEIKAREQQELAKKMQLLKEQQSIEGKDNKKKHQ